MSSRATSRDKRSSSWFVVFGDGVGVVVVGIGEEAAGELVNDGYE